MVIDRKPVLTEKRLQGLESLRQMALAERESATPGDGAACWSDEITAAIDYIEAMRNWKTSRQNPCLPG